MARRRSLLTTLRDERGIGALLGAVAVTMIVGTVWVTIYVVPALISDVVDLMRKTPAPTATQAGPTTDLFIGTPGLPDEARARECWINVMSSHGITWTSNGWRSRSHAAPELTGDAAIDRGAISVWKDGVVGYVNSYVDDARRACAGAPEQAASTTSTTLLSSLNGTYAMTNTGGTCTGARMSTLTATFSGPTLTISLQTPEGGLPLHGAPAESFSLASSSRGDFDPAGGFWGAPSEDVVIELHLLGRFVPDETPRIVDGRFEFEWHGQGGSSCFVTFTAVRTGG